MRRLVALLGVVGLALAAFVLPVRPVDAQSAQEMEISHSCIAVGQRIPDLMVWGSGWGGWTANGGRLTVEWSWGGGQPPAPATVVPQVQNAAASFSLRFDVNATATSFTRFGLVATNANGFRTSVGGVNLDIRTTCPAGGTVCTAEGAAPVLDASQRGYDPSWPHQFFYQYRTPGQVGPVAGVAEADGAMHGRFRGLSQVPNAKITVRIYQPPQGDTSPRYWFNTFPAPVCNPPAATTTTAPPTPGSTTTTTSAPDDTVPDATTTTTRPTGPGPGPGPTVTLPPAIDIPPPTPGAGLTLSPRLGPSGFVTGAVGTGFPPGPVTLAWSPGIGTTTAVVGPDGAFAVRVLVMPGDRLGPRALIATGAGGVTAYDAFLVLPSTVQPSGQDVAQISRIRRFNQR